MAKESYHSRQLQDVLNNEWLNDDHIENFANLFNKVASPTFNMQPQIYLYFPESIKPVPRSGKHIQILFSCSDLVPDDFTEPSNGHWVCSYYDSKKVFIYDSMGSKSMHEHHKRYLEKLFPFYNFEKRGSIIFPSVDLQPNTSDCGLFAMAFAVSILYGLKPDKVRYACGAMRAHFASMIQKQCIEHFPRAYNDTNIILPLSTVMQRWNNCNLEALSRTTKSNETTKTNDKETTKSNETANFHNKVHDISCNDYTASDGNHERKLGDLDSSTEVRKSTPRLSFRSLDKFSGIAKSRSTKKRIVSGTKNASQTDSVYQEDNQSDRSLHNDLVNEGKRSRYFGMPKSSTNIKDNDAIVIDDAAGFDDTTESFDCPQRRLTINGSKLNSGHVEEFGQILKVASQLNETMNFRKKGHDISCDNYTACDGNRERKLVDRDSSTEVQKSSPRLSFRSLDKFSEIYKSKSTKKRIVLGTKNASQTDSVNQEDHQSDRSSHNDLVNEGKRSRYFGTPNSSSKIKDNDVIVIDDAASFNDTTESFDCRQRRLIINGSKLNSDHVEEFGQILKVASQSEFEQRSPWHLYHPERIEPVASEKRHIQILFSCSELVMPHYQPHVDGHWVCSYYDSKKIHIFDSMNGKTLHRYHKMYLEKLFPFYDFSTDRAVLFPTVDQQGNGNDCGVFAVAFAVSIFCGLKPQNVRYLHAAMREHCSQMFDTKVITHFPRQSSDTNVILSMTEIQKRREKSARKAAERKSKTAVGQKSTPASDKQRSNKYYNAHRQQIRKRRKLYYDSKNHKCKNIVIKNIKKKYKKLDEHRNWIVTKFTKAMYIRKISEGLDVLTPVECRIEAERIVKWCFHLRNSYFRQLWATLRQVRNTSEICLTRAAQCSNATCFNEYVQALCGVSMHHPSAEAYFTEISYRPIDEHTKIIMNAKGQAINILPLIQKKGKSKAWTCGGLCKIDDCDIVNRMKTLLEQLKCCPISKLTKLLQKIHSCSINSNPDIFGHSHACYIDPTACAGQLLPVEILSPHFPTIRYIKRSVYRLMELRTKIETLDIDLNNTAIEVLTKIANEVESKAQAATLHAAEIDLNETSIMAKFNVGINAFTKRSMDTARYPCISCQKLCFKRNVTLLTASKISSYGDIWLRLKQFLSQYESIAEDNYICLNCHTKFKQDKMPSTCLLNGLYVGRVPPEIEDLNTFEKILIQRAKSFQIVHRAGTIMNKNLPHRHMIPKAEGTNFILPLPLEETLKRICPTEDPINSTHELFIIVRGIPTKSKIVWEKLVDLKKVWNALKWLQNHNPLYSAIRMPRCHDHLLPSNMRAVEFPIDEKSPTRAETSPCIAREEAHLDGDSQVEPPEKRAILTQMSQTDPYYESFSIFPTHETRINSTATELYQMLKVHDIPLDKRLNDLDLMCFPELFPHGENGENKKRSVSLSASEFYKSRLMCKHSRFRLNIQYLFYASNNNMIRQLNAGIFHKLNVTNPKEKYTAGDYLGKLNAGQLESNLNTIFSRLRNTAQFWKVPKSNLKCMTRNYGPATWFLTVSPAEWLWDDLLDHLRHLHNISETTHVSPMELIVRDPVATSVFIDNKFHALLDFLCSPANPIGKVDHYFWRREYQSRGTQHFHLLIWIRDAPVIGKSLLHEISSFILRYVTCRKPDKNVSPLLHRRVVTHQTHHHSSYCLRNKKTKTGFVRRCRFGFPRSVTETLKLRDVAISIAGRRRLKTRSRLYDLPRSASEVSINDYNPALLCVWEGNMDIQFVGENSTLLTEYATKYLLKPEKSNSLTASEIINSSKSLASNLWGWALRSLRHRECGAQEAADSVLGISLCGTDRGTTIKWIDVNNVRARKVKPRKTIEQLDANSTDIFYPSLVDTHYPNRPTQLETLSLYDFARWYDITKIKPKTLHECYYVGNSTYLKKRSRACLINHYIYSVKIEPERYYSTLLLLFQPWRKADELKHGYDTYAEAFMAVQSDLMSAMVYHDRLSEIQEAIDSINEQVDKRLPIGSDQAEKDPDDNGALDCVPVEVEEAVKDIKDAADTVVPNLKEILPQLNADQTRIFDRVTTCMKNNEKIVRLYVSGEGGTGKSFLISALRSWAKEILGKDTAVTAPTGIAAFNVNGLTLHRLFQLPVEHGRTPEYRQLSDVVLKALRDELRNVALIIIDEVSMISNVTLMYIHLRLTEIFETNDSEDGWFGRRHIILFGDLLQLPPVHEDSVYVSLKSDKIEKFIGAMGEVDLWRRLFAYDELRINMRQKGDELYRNILSRIRLGVVTDQDTKILNSRKIVFPDVTIDGRLHNLCDYICKLPSDTVCLLPTCKQCEILNTAMISRIPSPEIQLIARDAIDCPHFIKQRVSKKLCTAEEDNSRTAGLAKEIIIKIGAQIMIRKNIDVTLGLVNGTIAKIIRVRRDALTNDIESLTLLLPSGLEYIIERTTVKFQVMDRAFVVRKQFPICLSYGMTIHKSQGLSLKNAVIDAGNSVFIVGQIYVALSRISSLAGLHLINYDPACVKSDASAIREYNWLRQQYRPDLEPLKVTSRHIAKVRDNPWAISTGVLDCQDSTKTIDPKAPFIHQKGLTNDDSVSCYANAALQCMIHSALIQDAMLKCAETGGVLSSFVKAYNSKTRDTINAFAIRQLVGERFVEKIQQDVSEFITLLCEKCSAIRNVIEHEISHALSCPSCDRSIFNKERNNILLLAVPPKQKAALTMQDIIDFNCGKWSTVEEQCSQCRNKSLNSRTEIHSIKRVLIVQLLLFVVQNNLVKRKHCNIKAVPTTTVRINQCDYKVVSAIFHHGNDVSSGHYTCMIRSKNKSWIAINDSSIRPQHWPRNSKDVYVLFLQQN